jgi:hypothetical protein
MLIFSQGLRDAMFRLMWCLGVKLSSRGVLLRVMWFDQLTKHDTNKLNMFRVDTCFVDG